MSPRIRRWGTAGLAATYLTQVIACAPRVRERPPHELAVAVEPPESEIVVYEWNGEVVAGPVLSPATVQIPRSVGHRSYVVRVSKPGYCPQYWITGVEDHTLPWMPVPVSGGSETAAITIAAVVVVVVVLAMLAQADADVTWVLTPVALSGSLVASGGDSCE